MHRPIKKSPQKEIENYSFPLWPLCDGDDESLSCAYIKKEPLNENHYFNTCFKRVLRRQWRVPHLTRYSHCDLLKSVFFFFPWVISYLHFIELHWQMLLSVQLTYCPKTTRSKS